MIVRIFEVIINPELRRDFERDFATVSVDAVRNAQGFISCLIGRPTRWHPDRYAMITRWENEAALAAFAGEDWNRAVIPQAMARYVASCSVVHYEADREFPTEVRP